LFDQPIIDASKISTKQNDRVPRSATGSIPSTDPNILLETEGFKGFGRVAFVGLDDFSREPISPCVVHIAEMKINYSGSFTSECIGKVVLLTPCNMKPRSEYCFEDRPSRVYHVNQQCSAGRGQVDVPCSGNKVGGSDTPNDIKDRRNVVILLPVGIISALPEIDNLERLVSR